MVCISKNSLALLGFLILALLSVAHAAVRGAKQHAQEVKADRELSLQTETYDYTMTAIYTWPELFVPDGTSVAEVRDVVRLTQVFYRRLLAQAYPFAYKQVICEFISADADPNLRPFQATLEFSTTVTYQFNPDIPSTDESLATITNFDPNADYLNSFVRAAFPADLFPL